MKKIIKNIFSNITHIAKCVERTSLPTVSKFLTQKCVFYRTQIHGAETVKRCIAFRVYWGGVKVDHELNFNEDVSSCKKTSQKLNVLSQIVSFMTFDQRKLILNSFITSHFSYFPIVWMFHSRKVNERINHIHERALRGCSYGGELARLDELARLSEISPSLRNSYKSIMCSYER